MDFKVGQKVECRDDSDPAYRQGLRRGAIYIVSGVEREFIMIPMTDKCLWFKKRFIPLSETDISIFTQMLNDVRVKEPV